MENWYPSVMFTVSKKVLPKSREDLQYMWYLALPDVFSPYHATYTSPFALDPSLILVRASVASSINTGSKKVLPPSGDDLNQSFLSPSFCLHATKICSP